MATLQSVRGHSGLTDHYKFFDIRALWHSGTLALWHFGTRARVPECQTIKKGELDQYGAERFGRLILPQPKKCGTDQQVHQ